MHPFTIMVDSDCDLPLAYIQKHDIQVMPMPFTFNGREYPSGDWAEISGKEFYDGLRRGGSSTTTLVNLDTFGRVFTGYAQRGEDLLMIVLSSGLSSSYQTSQIALQEVREKYPDCNIFALDSINATSGCGLLAKLAVGKRAEGLTASETAAWLEAKKGSCFALFMVDDLMYLHRGGRLSKLNAVAGSLLGIKPILCITPSGTLAIKEKARRHKGAMDALIRRLKEITGGAAMDTLYINHTDCPEEAEQFASMVREAVDVKDVIVLMMGPIIGTHLGPGALTLLFEGGMTRAEYDEQFPNA